jgi:alpha-glucosidase
VRSAKADAGVQGRSPWWRGCVLYQIYPRSFFDSNADGIGDLPGITSKLGHVASLGVDGIWLSPFFVSPQRDFGYDVSDHQAVDPVFGTLADFDRLISRAHDLGLRVLIDQVWSHTSDRHPWFEDSRRRGRHGDWYVWADPRPDGTPPNNWLSVFGGSAWSWEPRRRQFYLHHFLDHQPALDLGNPAVVEAMLAVGAFWLERGVDGFRLDAVDFMTHDALLRDNPAQGDGVVPLKPFGMQIHRHDMLQPATAGVLARIRALTDRYPGRVTLGEISSQDGAFERVSGLSDGADGLHMAYTLRTARGGFDRPSLEALIRAIAGQGERGWPCWSFSNHDVERVASRWTPGGDAPDPRVPRLLATLFVCLRGSLCLYQGEELGLTEAVLAQEDLRDPFGIAYWPEFRGRDGSRTPMPWDPGCPHAGFTTADRPWLPVPAAHMGLAVAAQERDPEALIHHWRRLLRWRRSRPAVVSGALRVLDLPAPLIGFRRDGPGEVIACVFNLGPETAAVPVSGATVGISTGVVTMPGGGRGLAGYGALVTEGVGLDERCF